MGPFGSGITLTLIGPLVRLKTVTSRVARRAGPHPGGTVTVRDVDVAAETAIRTPSSRTVFDAAFEANQMIVVVTAGHFVCRRPVAKTLLMRHAELGQELHRPVDRGKTNPGLLLLDQVEERVEREMIMRLEEHLRDDLTLAGVPEATLDERRLKGLSLLLVPGIPRHRLAHRYNLPRTP